MNFARLNGGVLHWDVAGAGEAVVFVNSLGSELRIWDSVAALLARDCRAIRFDMRGHGLSDLARMPFGIDGHAEDVLALLDHAGVQSCTLVGLSVGGLVAQCVAARRPERVRALVLCATAARIGTPEGWAARIEAVERDGLEAIAEAVLERWFARWFRAQRPEALAGWRNMLVRTPVAGYVATCAAIRDADLAADAAAIRAPCLCVVGDEDGATPPELVRATAALIPGARFEVIDGAGHLPCIDQPERLAALIGRHHAEHGHG